MQQLTPKAKTLIFLTVIVIAVVALNAGVAIPFWEGAFHAAIGAGAIGMLIETVRFLSDRKVKL